MPPARPQPGCHEVLFEAPVRLDEPSEVALEDYARTLASAARAPARVRA